MKQLSIDDSIADLAVRVQMHLAKGCSISKQAIKVSCYKAKPDFVLLEQLNKNYSVLTKLNVEKGSWLDFVLSKPAIKQGEIFIHALTFQNELWLKLKSSMAIADSVKADAVTNEDSGLTQLQNLILNTTATMRVELLRVDGGPQWLTTPLAVTGDLVQIPLLLTPLDVEERFAGHCYIKLLLPGRPPSRGTVLNKL